MVGLYFVFQISLHLVSWFRRINFFFYYESPGLSTTGEGYWWCVFVGQKARHPSIIISSGSQVDSCQASCSWWTSPLRLLTCPHALNQTLGRGAFPKGLTWSLCLWSGYIGGWKCLLHTKAPLRGRKNFLLWSITVVLLSLCEKIIIFLFWITHIYISYEFHFALETILREVRICSVRILICLGLTWFTRYWFPKELISPLAKPLLTLPFDWYFVCTQSTEAFLTYVATSSISCSYFVFPLISHQIWCF